MARNKANQQNIDGSDLPNYPNKRIRNNSGTGDGTPVNESVYGDLHEFFAKLMREAKIEYNDLPDNVSNDYQLYQALIETANKNNYIKTISLTAPDIINLPVRISVLKNDETIVFKANFDSVNTITAAKGSDTSVKNVVKLGNWKSGDLVRVINNAGNISITGLYDSQNVPNLVTTIENITTKFSSWEKIMSVFVSNGAMVFWNKPAIDIPIGWAEVVNWRGRFPVGLNTDEPEFNLMGKTGGLKKVTLTESQMPKHSHSFGKNTEKVGTGNANGMSRGDGTAVQVTTSEKGNNEGHENLPPYRTVLFIEYIG